LGIGKHPDRPQQHEAFNIACGMISATTPRPGARGYALDYSIEVGLKATIEWYQYQG